MNRLLILALISGCAADYTLLGKKEVEARPILLEEAEEWILDWKIEDRTPLVDILFVLDNSGSMDWELWDLRDDSDLIMQPIIDSGVNYHVGVITADAWTKTQQGTLNSGSGYLWVDNNTPDPLLAFNQNISVPFYGAEPERGLDTTWMALVIKRDKENAGFFREEAALHVIAVSDENDQSWYRTPDDMIHILKSFAEIRPAVSFSSVVHLPPAHSSCKLDPPEEPGNKYIRVTNEVGGTVADICRNDWLVAVSHITEEITIPQHESQYEFVLSRTPVEETISVSVTADESTLHYYAQDDWEYNSSRNSIIFFEFWPSAGALIEVLYLLDD